VSELPAAVVVWRTAHGLIAAGFLAAIGYVWWCALTGRRGRGLKPAIAALAGEGIVVAAGVLGRGAALQHLHVRPGAEAAAGAGHHDRPDVGVGARLLQQVEVAHLHVRDPRVQALGSVQRQHGHAVLDVVQHYLGRWCHAHVRTVTR
jgi:hypothetical protein